MDAATYFPTDPASESRVALSLIRESLATLRSHLDLESAFVVEHLGDEAVVRFVDGDDRDGQLAVGSRHPRERAGHPAALNGQPLVAADLTRRPGLNDSYAAQVLGARAFVGVAFGGDAANPTGALCCLSGRPDHRLRQRDVDIVRMVANVIAASLGRLRSESRSYRETAAVLGPVLAGGIDIAFQPIIDLDHQTIVGHEALARFPAVSAWTTEDWFAAARSIGYGVELEVVAVTCALRAWPRLTDRGYLSLNVSPTALSSPELRAALQEFDLTDIVFEITEHERFESTPAFIAALDQWRAAGARIAVDDAGSGYAGLRQVLRIAPDVLKLDRSLVADAHLDPARQALAWSLSWFARRTGAVVVAEGIETAEELETLHSMGVHFGQGYYLGRPAPA